MTYSYWDGAKGLSVIYNHNRRIRRVELYLAAVLVLVLLCAFGSITRKVFASVQEMVPAPVQQFINETIQSSQPAPIAPASFNADALNKSLTAWSARSKGTKGVVITDADGSVLAETGSSDQFFMASIYKLYVAYLGYQQIDAGVHSLDEPFLNGWSRGKCLDEMIRNSDSPCAEKLMGELGRQNIQDKLQAYGITQTSFRALTTCAGDVSKVLTMIWKGTDLSQQSRLSLLASMSGQKYRNGLPKGFQGATVYNKVGFQDEDEYHDVGIVQMADGRVLTISVLTKNTGVRSISQLASVVAKQ